MKNLNRNRSARKDDDQNRNKKKLEELNLKKNNNINNGGREKTLEKGSYGSKSKDVVGVGDLGFGLKGLKMNVKKKR